MLSHQVSSATVDGGDRERYCRITEIQYTEQDNDKTDITQLQINEYL